MCAQFVLALSFLRLGSARCATYADCDEEPPCDAFGDSGCRALIFWSFRHRLRRLKFAGLILANFWLVS